MQAEFWSRAGALWGAQLMQKVCVLVFSFFVGHRLGAEGVGVMASVLALSWMGGTVAGIGLPDRALFRGAADDNDPENRRLHGFFLLAVGVVHVGLWWYAPGLAGTEDPALVTFARGLIVGAGLQCASALGLGWLRGATVVTYEALSTVLCGVVLIVGALMSLPLGLVWALGGGCFLLGSVLGNIRMSGIVPSVPFWTDMESAIRAGVPYLMLGIASWAVGNIDILLGRLFHPPSDVGALQVGTMAVRGLGLLPWVAATLMLRTLHDEWAKGKLPHPWVWLRNSMFVGLLVAALAWLLMPLLAQGHAIPVSSIERSTLVAMVFAPVTYAVILLIPIAAQWSLRGTLKALAMGLMVQAGLGWVSMDTVEVASCVLVAGVGQFVVLLWLVNSLRVLPKERIKMDGGTM